MTLDFNPKSPAAQVLENTDLLREIFSYLPSAELGLAASVCRNFYKPAIQNLTQLETANYIDLSRIFCHVYNSIAHEVGSQKILLSHPSEARFRSGVVLDRIGGFSDRQKEIFQTALRPYVARIRSMSTDDGVYLELDLTRLKNLISMVIPFAKSLRHFNLRYLESPAKTVSLTQEVAPLLQGVTHLKLSRGSALEKEVDLLSGLPQLQHVTIRIVQINFSEPSLKMLQTQLDRLAKLKPEVRLSLNFSENFNETLLTDNFLASLIPHLMPFSELELNLSSCTQITDDGFRALEPILSKIVSLKVGGKTQWNDRVYGHAVRLQISESCLIETARSMEKLTCLDLSDKCHLSKEALLLLACCLKTLTHLNLGELLQREQDEIALAFVRACPNLQELQIGLYTYDSSHQIREFAVDRQLERLKSFTFSLANLQEELNKLKKINPKFYTLFREAERRSPVLQNDGRLDRKKLLEIIDYLDEIRLLKQLETLLIHGNLDNKSKIKAGKLLVRIPYSSKKILYASLAKKSTHCKPAELQQETFVNYDHHVTALLFNDEGHNIPEKHKIQTIREIIDRLCKDGQLK